MYGTAATDGNSPVPAVLRQFGFSPRGWECAEATPGFSGATVWKVTSSESPLSSFALKRWPPGQPAFTPLGTIHHWMQAATSHGVASVPIVRATPSGVTVVHYHNLVWDLVTWMPGQPVSDPSHVQLEQVIRQMDALHSVWKGLLPAYQAPCPAVILHHQRLQAWKPEEWEQLQHNTMPLCLQSVYLLKQRIPQAIRSLSPWLNRKVTLQPCLADIWADHVLFQNDTLSGIIDFGGARMDHPAQDLARLISSYSLSASRPLDDWITTSQDRSDTNQSLARLLAQTGLIVSLSNWIRWLFLENRQFINPMNCIQRAERILFRLCTYSDKLLGGT